MRKTKRKERKEIEGDEMRLQLDGIDRLESGSMPFSRKDG